MIIMSISSVHQVVQWYTVLPILALLMMPFALVIPHAPRLGLLFFKGQSDQLLFYEGLSSSISAVFSLALVPSLGRFSDRFGRIVPLAISCVLEQFAPVALLLGLRFDLYLVLRTILLISGTMPLSMAFVADRTTKATRPIAFATSISTLMATVIVGPVVGAKVPFGYLKYLAVAAMATTAVYGGWLSWLVWKERHSQHGGVRRSSAEWAGPIQCWKTLMKTKEFVPIILFACLSSGAEMGVLGVGNVYLKSKFNASKNDIAMAGVAFGCSEIVSQMVLLSILRSFLRRRTVLVFSSLSVAGSMFWLSQATGINEAPFIYMGFGLALMQSPVLNTVVSFNASLSNQGLSLALLGSAKSLATGFGPLVLGILYTIGHDALGVDGFPFLVGGAVVALSVVILFFIPESFLEAKDLREEQQQEQLLLDPIVAVDVHEHP